MAVDSGGKRAARIAKLVVDIMWWLGLGVSALVVVAVLAAPVLDDIGIATAFRWNALSVDAGSGPPTLELRVSVVGDSASTLADVASADTMLASAPRVTRTGETRLAFRTRQWGLLYSANALLLLCVAAALLGIYQLRAFLAAVLDADVFSLRNASRLSTLGWLLIGVDALGTPLERLRGWMILRGLSLSGPQLSADAGDTNGLWLVGLLMLVVAAAWRYGAELQQERDLTV